MHLELIAFLAGLISATAAIPQIWTIFKTRDTSGVSSFMFGMKNFSCSLWVVFGIITNTYSIILWNAISLGLCMTVVIMKHVIQKQDALAAARVIEHNRIIAMPVYDAASIMEAAQAYTPKRPHLRLVYSRPKEVQQSLPLDMPEIAAESPAPQV